MRAAASYCVIWQSTTLLVYRRMIDAAVTEAKKIGQATHRQRTDAAVVDPAAQA